VADTPSPPSPEILEKLRQLREELAQKAAQQAPKSADTLAWQQSNAFKRIYPRAEGGVIDMDRMRLELMNKGGVLPRKKRDAGLEKFLSDSQIKERLYHATPNDFSAFKPGGDKPAMSGRAVWLSADSNKQPASHNIHIGDGNYKQGVNVMPVHVKAKNPLVLDDPTMIEWAREVFAGGSKEFPELLPPHWIDAVKKEGYDSIHFADPYGHGDPHEVIMFEPNKIKSAIGNRGTYDTTNPDITKAKGGSVMGVNVASDRKHNLNYADLIVDGHKTIESRNSDTLRPYVGKRVAIVRTGAGKAKAIGEVTIGEPIVANKKQFRNMESHHLVPEGSTFDIKTPTKHMYPLSEPVRYDEERDVGHGILSRKVIHKDKGGKIEVRPTVFDDAASRRNPKIEAAARALMEGEMTKKAYEKVVAKEKPVKRYDFIPKPATDEQAMNVLIDRQKQNWRSHENWPAGHRVGLRLDIPSYERHGVWVNSIHDESGGEDKFPTSYGSVSSVRNATFEGSPNKAIRVATGEQNKTPFARIKGELEHIDEKKAIAHMKKYLNHPDYRQVGYDPRRHGDFYDRETREPVTHSEHVVQIGPLVLAKKPKYGKREVYAKGGTTHAHHLQIEERPL